MLFKFQNADLGLQNFWNQNDQVDILEISTHDSPKMFPHFSECQFKAVYHQLKLKLGKQKNEMPFKNKVEGKCTREQKNRKTATEVGPQGRTTGSFEKSDS